MEIELEEWQNRYIAAAHALQTGVMYEMEWRINDAATPKHLRTGVNLSLLENGALVGLLVEKGIITELEWFKALTLRVEQEVHDYEERLSKARGINITLG